MRKFLIAAVLVLISTAAFAANPFGDEPSSELDIVIGGDNYVGGAIRYDNVGIRVGKFDETVCVRACGRRCREFGTEDAGLYEFVGYIPVYGPLYGQVGVGILNASKDTDATVAAGLEYRYKQLTVGVVGSSTDVKVMGFVGFSKKW